MLMALVREIVQELLPLPPYQTVFQVFVVKRLLKCSIIIALSLQIIEAAAVRLNPLR